ncbi:Uncharacterized protein TCM_043701 [Theobroma cacao]|uniref:Uncharacterized protein n=1 Tax=Theobroma cacao TaxID=3641 RepID=A0A061FW48_THECC|nr:Uncharacterized protein TCM_043701 [Theobroma cacao]
MDLSCGYTNVAIARKNVLDFVGVMVNMVMMYSYQPLKFFVLRLIWLDMITYGELLSTFEFFCIKIDMA